MSGWHCVAIVYEWALVPSNTDHIKMNYMSVGFTCAITKVVTHKKKSVTMDTKIAHIIFCWRHCVIVFSSLPFIYCVYLFI